MKIVDKHLPAVRISPMDEFFFFGYYDLQPFNKKGNLHLAHKAPFMDRLQVRDDVASVGVIDMSTRKFEKLADTKAWNFQQGAMLQWNELAPDDEIIYNDVVDGELAGVVMNINTGNKRYLDRPVSNVSKDGRFALSVNMSRLYNFRPGYGYAIPEDSFYWKNHDKDDGVFVIDMLTGKSKLVLSLDEIWERTGSHFGKDEKMNINHITFNPSGNRFLALVRNFPKPGQRHDTAMITVNRDGSDFYLLSDYGVQSHYYWIDDETIIIYNDGKELDCTRGWGNNYILKDKTHNGYLQADGFFWEDNHMSYSPDGKYMLNDTYPRAYRMQTLRVYYPEGDILAELGRYYSMEHSTTDIRCDLHPRWNRTGDMITFDSTHEGYRGIYSVEFNDGIKKQLFE